VAAAVLLGTFVAVQLRGDQPIVKRSLLSERTLSVSAAVQLLIAAGFFGLVFTFTLYMQQVLGYRPLTSGFAYLPLGAGLFVGVGLAAGLSGRLGARPLMVGGSVLCALGLLLLTGVGVRASYASDLLPGLAVFGLGAGALFPALTIAAMSRVREADAGVASGVLQASSQVGGALGLGLLVALSAHRLGALLAAGHSRLDAQVGASHYAFAGGAALCAAAAVLAMFVGRVKPPGLHAETTPVTPAEKPAGMPAEV
jgi:MFS family permease